MLKEPLSELKDSNVAIVAMGQSQIDYHLSRTHSLVFDEIWAINAMIGVLPEIDRAFILDPMTRFFDTEDAGSMTPMMRKYLPTVTYPIYTCELDERVPYAEEYPLPYLVGDLGCAYFNNTVAYAIAFALWNQVSHLTIFGVDFTYKTNMHYAESGKACCEFWLAKCMENNINVSVAPRSNLLETNVDIKEKLYGYHRLKDPIITYQKEDTIKTCRWSEVEQINQPKPQMIDRNDLPPEPEEY
jgi:hypothetical protein|tara:strand:+ start:4127 stop:4855 length:729 start_codon:yes stop_codon:yes gene_type:complete